MDWIVELQQLAASHVWLAWPAYLLAFCVVVMLGLPGGLLMMLLGGFLFGATSGALLATCGATLAAGLTYSMTRSLLGRALRERAGEQRLQAVRSWLVRRGPWGALSIRLVPVFPFFVVNLALSAIGLPWRTYLATVVLGTMPTAWLVARLGAQAQDLKTLEDLADVSLLLQPSVVVPLLVLIGLSLSAALLRFRYLKDCD